MKKKISIKNNSLIRFFKEASAELKKVVWPKRREVVKKTLIVIIAMIIVAAVIGLLDYGLYQGIKILIGLN